MRSLFRSRERKPVPEPVPPLHHPSEDILKQLVDYDVIVLMDDSPSMKGARWAQAKKVMKQVVEVAAMYDDNGIEIRFLNELSWGNVKNREEVKQLFRGVSTSGSTPLGSRLGDICTQYLQRLENATSTPKRCLIIAITDGIPDKFDIPRVYSTIKDTTEKLDELSAPASQVGIQFVQIGDDPGATEFLRELDDTLKGNTEDKASRDIVDTVPYNGVNLTADQLVKILAGAINRKVDRQMNRPRHRR